MRCLKYALDTLGAPCPADDVLATFIGPPLRGTFATLLETADRIVRRLGLEPYFAGVYGPELQEGRFDDKAELLGHLLATEEVSPERAIMIGDRAGDIVIARANRVRSIGVLWGYGSESELGAAGADGLCATPDDLTACLGRLPL